MLGDRQTSEIVAWRRLDAIAARADALRFAGRAERGDLREPFGYDGFDFGCSYCGHDEHRDGNRILAERFGESWCHTCTTCAAPTEWRRRLR